MKNEGRRKPSSNVEIAAQAANKMMTMFFQSSLLLGHAHSSGHCADPVVTIFEDVSDCELVTACICGIPGGQKHPVVIIPVEVIPDDVCPPVLELVRCPEVVPLVVRPLVVIPLVVCDSVVCASVV